MASQDFEIVRVISECRLIDEESFEHVYWRRDGKPLALGCYIVSWPPGAKVGRYNEEAVFHGPYRERKEALAALEEPAARAAHRSAAPPADRPAPPCGRAADPFEELPRRQHPF
jgi:hypothetical protein